VRESGWTGIAGGALRCAHLCGGYAQVSRLPYRRPPWHWVLVPCRAGWRGPRPEGAAGSAEAAMAAAEAAGRLDPLA
jgi:hypothetical protein